MAGGLNLYQFNGNNPVSNSDPFGLCPWCIGAVGGVATGFALATLTGDDYSLKDAAIDAAVGAVGGGIATKLGKLGRALGAVDDAARGAAKGGRALTNDEIVEAVAKNADEVKIGRTAKDAGDFVNIKFKDGTVANIRVDTHPPRGLHGNVQIWKR